MSNLKDWLCRRRSRFYSGEQLTESINSFLTMLRHATIHEFPEAIIVLEDVQIPGVIGVARAWLLFDKFTRGTVRAMKQVSDDFKGLALVAETHDVRIRNLLLRRMGYEQVHYDGFDYHLIKWSNKHGV